MAANEYRLKRLPEDSKRALEKHEPKRSWVTAVGVDKCIG